MHAKSINTAPTWFQYIEAQLARRIPTGVPYDPLEDTIVMELSQVTDYKPETFTDMPLPDSISRIFELPY